MAGAWLTLRKAPGPTWRARLERELGIPAVAWGQIPHAVESIAPSVIAQPTVELDARQAEAPSRGDGQPHIEPGGLGEIDDLLAAVRAARRDPNLLAGERLKAAQEESKLLAHRARLAQQLATRDETIEALCVRHPRWLELKRAIIEAIRPHREALLAVAEVLRSFDVADPYEVTE